MIDSKNGKALYRARKEAAGSRRPDASDWFRHRGEDFWHSVWARIERNPPPQQDRHHADIGRQPPLDYVVESEARA